MNNAIRQDPDAGLALADDECFCAKPTVATNEYGESWCSVCGERLIFAEARCPACGDPIDYCQGHGPIGDPAGATILDLHDEGDHSRCNPDGCDDAAAAESDAENAERYE